MNNVTLSGNYSKKEGRYNQLRLYEKAMDQLRQIPVFFWPSKTPTAGYIQQKICHKSTRQQATG